MKNIFTTQNEDIILNWHVAKDGYYQNAEWYWWLGFWGTLLISIALFVYHQIKIDLPLEDLITILIGGGSFLLQRTILSWSEKQKRFGAIIQDMIDTHLFNLPWNTKLVPEGKLAEDAIRIGKLKSKRTPVSYKNWYVDAPLPLESFTAKVLECQRRNISYDYRQRNKFKHLSLVILSILTLAVFSFLWWKNLNFHTAIIDVIAPLSGFWGFWWNNYQKNHQMVQQQVQTENVVKNKLASLERHPTIVDQTDLREIQDFIFKNRATLIIIPDRYYKYYRNHFEKVIIQNEE